MEPTITHPLHTAQPFNILTKSFVWMMGGFFVSAITSFIVLSSPALLDLVFGTPYAFVILLLLKLALVWYIGSRIDSISASTARWLFIGYAISTGIVFSFIFIAFDLVSILSIFVGTIAVFGVFALYGKKTAQDMTSWGPYLLAGLVGLIVTTIVNLFVANSVLDLLVGAVGVVIFVGFTAYDVQQIKALSSHAQTEEEAEKMAVIGALHLYLDFVNLFLSLLRLFGRRR